MFVKTEGIFNKKALLCWSVIHQKSSTSLSSPGRKIKVRQESGNNVIYVGAALLRRTVLQQKIQM